jgi:sugar/nucleoside kinase (ribokinase family)
MPDLPPAVLCYGEIGVDNIIRVDRLPTPEIAVFPTADTAHIGGAAANTGAWLARWGIPVRLMGNAIGTDEYGWKLAGWLGEHPSLNLDDVQIQKGLTTPFCRVLVTPDAERSFLIFAYPQAPKTPLTVEHLDGVQYLALDLYGGDERLAAARLAHQHGVTTLIGDVITPDHPALPYTSIATNSAAFIRNTLPDVDVIEHAYRLQAVSGGIIVLTDGPRPIHVLYRDGGMISVQPPPVQAVDATGAGDAFRAGLIAGLLRDMPLAESVRIGAAAGAFKVQSVGAAAHIPAWEEVAALADTLQIM